MFNEFHVKNQNTEYLRIHDYQDVVLFEVLNYKQKNYYLYIIYEKIIVNTTKKTIFDVFKLLEKNNNIVYDENIVNFFSHIENEIVSTAVSSVRNKITVFYAENPLCMYIDCIIIPDIKRLAIFFDLIIFCVFFQHKKTQELFIDSIKRSIKNIHDLVIKYLVTSEKNKKDKEDKIIYIYKY